MTVATAQTPGLATEQPPWWWRVSPTVVGSAVAVGLAVWSTHGAWGGRPPGGEDVMAHLVRADFGIGELVNHGRLDGWMPRFYLGYQEFLFNGPGLTWLVAGLRGLTFGALSNTGALKVAGVLSFAMVPPAIAFLARSLGLGRLAAGLAAVLSLLVSNEFGVGLAGVYDVGLVSHQVGAVLFCIALGALVRVPVDGRTRWVIVGGASLAALAVTHLISLMILAVLFALVAGGFFRRLTRAGLRGLGATAAVATGLAGWWIVPALAHRDLRGIVATWATPPFGRRVGDVLDGRLLFRPHTAVIVLVAWGYTIVRVRDRRPFALAIVVAPVAYLVISHWSYSRWPTNEFTLQLANRGLGYVGLLAVLPLATALAAAARLARERATSRAWVAPVSSAAALAAATGVVLSPLGPSRTVAAQLPDPVPSMRAAAARLGKVVPDGARFATARDYPSEIDHTGIVQPDTWLARTSGRNSLNGFNLESSSTPSPDLEPEHIASKTPEESASTIARLGVSHLVTTSDELTDRLASSPRYLVVWRSSPMAILAVQPEGEHPPPTSLLGTDAPAGARLSRTEPEDVRIEANVSEATAATIALAWSPKWHATVNGRRVRLHANHDGLLALHLPKGRSRIELRYEPDSWDRLGIALSAGTLVALGARAAFGVRRRRIVG